jgi:tetratricopeptide (TPR) repeat protein
MYEAVFGPVHARVAETAMHLGAVLRFRRRWTEAREWLERSLDVTGRTLGHDHEFAAKVLGHLAAVDAHDGRHAEAAMHLERALAILRRVFGADDQRHRRLEARLQAEHEALGGKPDAE